MPHAVTYTAAEREGEAGTWTLRRDEISVAAAAIGSNAILLAKLLRQRHQTSSVAGRLRVDGVLTNRCAVCGATMTRKGYRAWITAPSHDSAIKRISSRLGFAARRTTTRTTWHRTRREAAAWARDERDRGAAPEGRLMTASYYADVIQRPAPRPRRGVHRGLDAPRAPHPRRPGPPPLRP